MRDMQSVQVKIRSSLRIIPSQIGLYICYQALRQLYVSTSCLPMYTCQVSQNYQKTVMNIYLFPIYFLFFLIYSYTYATIPFVMLMPYVIIQSYAHLSLSVFLIKPYLFSIFLQPFLRFDQIYHLLLFLVISCHSLTSIIFYYLFYPTVI